MKYGRFLGILFVGIIYFFSIVAHSQTNNEKLASIASKLFNIPLNQIDSSTGANYDYNGYGTFPSGICDGYDVGHSGIDIQTKDVAGSATADRDFFALLGGTVTSNPFNQTANAINIYNQELDVTVTYLHARQVFVAQNQNISAGDRLGVQGNVGLGHSNTNSAEHVHIEVRSGSEAGAACGASTALNPIDILYSGSQTSCFEFSGASGNTPTRYSDLKVGFVIKNNCSTAQTIQDVAISFHNRTNSNFIETCYRRNSSISIPSGSSRSTTLQKCNQENPSIENGRYKLVYKAKYGGNFKDVLNKDIEIGINTNITPILGLLLLDDKIKRSSFIVSGELTEAGQRNNHLITASNCVSGDTLTINLICTDGALDPVISVSSPGGVSYSDDDSGDDCDNYQSALIDNVPAENGVWSVEAYDFGSAVGLYTLKVTASGSSNCSITVF